MAKGPSSRRVTVSITLLLMLGLVWCLGSWAVAWQLTRRPRPRLAEAPPPSAWAEFESLRLTTADGFELGAWYAPGDAERGGVVLLHGKLGTRAACLPAARILRSAGCAVLLVSLRGHGDSSGMSLEFGSAAGEDVVAAVEWLEARRPGAAVVVRGSSLGGLAAACASSALAGRVHGWVFESLYADFPTAVRLRTAARLPAGLDRLAAWSLLIMGPLVMPGDSVDPSVALAGLASSAPVLVLTGEHDRLAPPEQARKLARAAGDEAVLAIVKGAGHERLHQPDPDAYGSLLLALVQRAEAHASRARQAPGPR